MSQSIQPVTTARLRPALFPHSSLPPASRPLVILLLSLVVITGLGFRAHNLSVDGLSEDEYNKLKAVEDYRARGLTSANGEHPMLMKGLLYASLTAAEWWNQSAPAAQNPARRIEMESALRFPGVVLGAFTALLIYLLAAELFGAPVGLIAAALWAGDPSAIGFNRIAKEDTFLLFFFLLANVFWLRGQRIAEQQLRRPEPYYWATAAAFGAMLASKYVPHFLAISTSYYYAMQGIPSARWRLGKKKWIIFFLVMGLAFVLCNPTILLPATWHEMKVFATEKRIGHDAYEFMGQLYPNQMTLWLKGSPWYFYYVFMAFKLPPVTLVGLLGGLLLVFRRRLGDGRIFLFFWVLFWFFPFTFLGGKFTRYFTFALPLVLIVAALGIDRLTFLLARSINRGALTYLRPGLAAVFLLTTAYAAALAAPHYRLYTNLFGGGAERAGTYFPHDEFYDGGVREAARRVAVLARPAARVASETPELFDFYAKQAGRHDLTSISLSDKSIPEMLEPGDIILDARGRRYFSNDALLKLLHTNGRPADKVLAGQTLAITIYLMDAPLVRALRELAGRNFGANPPRAELHPKAFLPLATRER